MVAHDSGAAQPTNVHIQMHPSVSAGPPPPPSYDAHVTPPARSLPSVPYTPSEPTVDLAVSHPVVGHPVSQPVSEHEQPPLPPMIVPEHMRGEAPPSAFHQPLGELQEH